MRNALAVAALLFAVSANAATPPGGSISSTSGPVSWTYAPVVAGTVVDTGVEDFCPPGPCDEYALALALPSPASTFYVTYTATLSIHYSWTSTVATDLDIFAYGPNGAKYGPGSPDTNTSGDNYEDLVITDPVDGVWKLRSVASLSPLPTAASATATLTIATRTASPSPNGQPHVASFTNYPADENMAIPLGSTANGAHGAGEPSIGVNWKSGAVFIESGNHTLRVLFDSAGNASWTDNRSPYARVSLDPILWADSSTGRVIESQLDGACSTMSYTEDDAQTWNPAEGCGTPAGPDHQTVGGGNYAAPAPAVHTYPHAVYYCSQGVATAICARSDDGGLTFGPGVPIYDLTQCNGLHGHVRVSPDGTAYVPNETCTDAAGTARPAVVVSGDNGLTWTVRTISLAKSSSSGGDPSIAAGSANTIYTGFVNYDGHAKVSVSHDRGVTWSKPYDVGTPYGIQNTEFAEVIAGDDDRAAYAFLGTTTPGNDQSSAFPGVWHLYVAFTYDGGRKWQTTDVTPSDPVQRGCIWNGGGNNACRNLLDFNDITTDSIGRVLIGYADGCTKSCVSDPTENASAGPADAQDSWATVARQISGQTLFGAFDGTLPK